MAEEQKWREPEGHRLCANNCGFFGNPTTLNLCSKCYRDFRILDKTLNQTASSSSSSSSSSSLDFITSDSVFSPGYTSESGEVKAAETMARPSRCGACRKRVGLTGFRCRCGTTFCGTHRYPEQHGCKFDFKGLGREAIAKANPVVIAEKLDKI